MTRAKEKDELSLGLFNQLLERRGLNVRIYLCQKVIIHVDPIIVQEMSTLSNANVRIRTGYTDRRVYTKAQVREELSFFLIRSLIYNKVASLHPVIAPTETSHAPSVFPLTHVPSPTRVKVEEGQFSSIDHRYTPSSPHTLTHRASFASMSRKRPTAGSCSTTTIAPIPPALGASGSLEARTHRSSSSTATPAIQRSSFELAGPRGIQPPIVQERQENVSFPPGGIPPHLLMPPPSHSSQSTRIDPPSNAIDVAPTVSPERATQRSSNSIPLSEREKVSPIHNYSKIRRSTRTSVTQRPSTKFAAFPLTPSEAGTPENRREAPSRLKMPGAFPGTSLEDADMSSWVLVSPVGPECQLEVPKRNWFKRMFSRFG